MALLLDKLSVYGEMLEAVSVTLAQAGALPLGDARSRLFPTRENETLERELLSYLQELGLVQVDKEVLRPTLEPEQGYGIPLRLHLLATVRARADENTVIMDLYRFLLSDESSARRVLERDEVWPRYNQYREAITESDVIMNSPKMASWLRLMAFLGLILPERSNSFVLSPSLDLLRAMLRRAADTTAQPLPGVIARLEVEYCPLLQRPGRLHPGYADALMLLERLGELVLTVVGDAEGLLLGDRRVTHIALAAGPGDVGEG